MLITSGLGLFQGSTTNIHALTANKIIAAGGGAPISKSRRQRRLQIVFGGGAARQTHGSTHETLEKEEVSRFGGHLLTCRWIKKIG